MALRIFNSLTRGKEDFAPIRTGEARVYVCGVTVYDLSHIGHARSAIVFDVVNRDLRFKGLRVTFDKNFTDVDDKIIRRANDEGLSSTDVSERYIAEYRADMASIGVLPADIDGPQALGVLFDLARVLNTARDQAAHGTAGSGAFLMGVAELLALARVLGLLEGAAPERAPIDPQLKARVDSLVDLRQEARTQRDFAEADRLRDEDAPGGTNWRLQ